MKKLIVLSVVFALVAAAAFAVDVSANVFGLVTPFQGESGTNPDGTDASDKITASGSLERLRLDGYAEIQDGKFGGYLRIEPAKLKVDDLADLSTDPDFLAGNGNFLKNSNGFNGYAFWKPVDQFKLILGGNGGDGFFGKEGVTGWNFQGNPYDAGVAILGNIWGGNGTLGKVATRDVFYGGFGGNGALMSINIIDPLGINIVIPFFDGGETADVFKKTTAQIDLNLDFGNIALTYQGASGDLKDQPKIYLYYGGSFGDLGIDFGFSYQLAGENEAGDSIDMPMGVGLGVKYATDAFGIKFRTVASLAGEKEDGTNILAELLPYFPLGDNLAAYVSLGLYVGIPDEGDSVLDWHFNPYIRVGEEFGAQFLVGVKVWSEGGSDGLLKWSVPIAIMAMF